MVSIHKLSPQDGKLHQDRILQLLANYQSSPEKSRNEGDKAAAYKELIETLASEAAFIYGAFRNETLLALIWAYKQSFRNDYSRIYVKNIYVDTTLDRPEISKELINHLEAEALHKGYHRIFTHLEAHDKKALDFFEALGYKAERLQLLKNEWGEGHFLLNKAKVETKVTLQKLNAEDLRTHQESLTELFRINTAAHMKNDQYEATWIRQQIDKLISYVAENKAIVVGGLDNNQMIAFMWTYPHRYKNKARYYVNAIAVLPAYRKQGLASQLFNSTENLLRENQKPIYTHVDAINEKSFNFFKKHGMKEELYQLTKKIS